jgi:hypothetical protein
VDKKESSKIVEINGRRFKFNRMDALTGSYVATKLLSKLSSVAMAIVAGAVDDMNLIAIEIAREISSLNKNEFFELEMDALGVVDELKNVTGMDDAIPIRHSGGTWAVEGIKDDIVLLMPLVVHSIMFNLSPFFDGDALKRVIGTFQGLNSFNAKT